MAAFPHRHYHQTLTYWLATPDKYSGYTFAAPAARPGRWEDKVDMFQDANGRQAISRAFIYMDLDLPIETYVYRGTSVAADPTKITDRQEKELVGRIRRRDITPSVDGKKQLWKYYLV